MTKYFRKEIEMRNAITKILEYIVDMFHLGDTEYPPMERFIRSEYPKHDWEWAREKHDVPSKIEYRLRYRPIFKQD